MKTLRNLSAGVLLSALSGLTLAAGNPLSVHVLNLENGLPSPDVQVTLEKQNGNQWTALNEGVTNEQGRITALYPKGKDL
ncbi:MAG: hydroxyisourate hydrolase, partial [Pseudomonadales bacterium 32-61-5]